QRQLRLETLLLTFWWLSEFSHFEGVSMLWTIFAILIILWLLGWGFHVAGGLIHLLLVIALVVAVINLVTGRRAV
ncbi:MAG TPA: lmo0937 family membrane protein, partial [Ktedonobacteraceae bacterium]|nr:lmo0937 family membrane protein [Ktedonobacteraceae bacterium]